MEKFFNFFSKTASHPEQRSNFSQLIKFPFFRDHLDVEEVKTKRAPRIPGPIPEENEFTDNFDEFFLNQHVHDDMCDEGAASEVRMISGIEESNFKNFYNLLAKREIIHYQAHLQMEVASRILSLLKYSGISPDIRCPSPSALPLSIIKWDK